MQLKHLWIVAVMGVISVPGRGIANGPTVAPFSAVAQATTWLNSEPLKAADFRGKVVLVDFWTYTCINWRRTLPWLRSWDQKYGHDGLLVLGVHTPEFDFEKDIDNVRSISHDQLVTYPIVIDSNQAIWNAFRNQYWPALYIVDAQENIRHEQFGEGDYDRIEELIRKLLEQAGHPTGFADVVSIEGSGAEAPADWKNLRSPETYVGYARSEHFASPGGEHRDRPHRYASPTSLSLNSWALAGDWTVKSEFAVSHAANGRIAFRFHARDVHVILGTDDRSHAVRFRVTIDGQPPAASHGLDVDENGIGTVVAPRMYQLIRQQQAIADRLVEIEFIDPGARVYDFTFG
jgi:thiol-disulfide isomerase/thioredoxin